jgi:uncharacterized protein (DUF924 family)
MFSGILKFWFEECSEEQWWTKNAAFDDALRTRFSTQYQQAKQCELFEWRHSAHGRLAEIIILDQFSRNMYRDSPQAFAQDSLALALAQEGLVLGIEQRLNKVERSFLYMPFMHSESLKIHERAVQLFAQNGIESHIKFEQQHKAIIEKFGRYPHRNKILGRESTPAELDFLQKEASSF